MDIDDFLKEDPDNLEKRLTKEMHRTAGEELVKYMTEVFGTEEKARDWYFSELIPLGGKRPYDFCKAGKCKDVEQIVGRIDYGVHS